MSELMVFAAFSLGVFLLLAVGLACNYARARRWEQKSRQQGKIICSQCGHQGPLTIGCRIGEWAGSSTNLRLVCANCSTAEWSDPKGPNQKGAA